MPHLTSAPPVYRSLSMAQYLAEDPRDAASQTQFFRTKPEHMNCPKCYKEINTRVIQEPTVKTHLLAFLFCLSVIGCYCFCFPYCIKCCFSNRHYCPLCRAYLGVYEPFTIGKKSARSNDDF